MAFMQITVIPVGTESISVGAYIADIAHFLEKNKIEHSMHDMGTVLAGESSDLLKIAAEIHRLPFTNGAERVITQISLDERAGKSRKIGDKKQSVQQRLQNKTYGYEKIQTT